MRTYATLLRTKIWNQRSSSAGMIVVLWLGLGTFSSLLTIRHGVLYRPIPLYEPERLVQIKLSSLVEGRPLELEYFTYEEFRTWKEGNRSFECFVAVQDGAKDNFVHLQGPDEPERLNAARITRDFLPCLGVSLKGGPGLSNDSAESSPEVLLGYSLWARKFGAARDIENLNVNFNQMSHRIVGVMPAFFQEEASQALLGRGADIWMPLNESSGSKHLGNRSIRIIGRLRDGRVPAEASSDLTHLLKGFPGAPEKSTVQLASLQEQFVERARPALRLLSIGGALVFILTCANATALLLGRNMTRSRESTIRLALGASRARFITEGIIEGLVLTGIAGALATITNSWWIKLVSSLAPDFLSHQAEIETFSESSLYTIGLSLLAGLALGSVTAIQASPSHGRDSLSKEGAPWVSPTAVRRLQRVAALEVASALVLLVGAGVVFQSYSRARRTPTGMNLQRVLAFDLFLPNGNHLRKEQARTAEFFEAVKHGISSLPGVENVAITSSVPLRSRDYYHDQWRLRKVDEHYFSLLQVPLIKGRTFESSDRGMHQKVAVVNQALARRFFPGQDPVGQIWNGQYRIIGVAPDTTHEDLGARPQPALYIYHWQQPDERMSFLIRTSVDPSNLIRMIKNTIWSLDPNQPISNISTLEDLVNGSAGQRMRMLFTLVFGAFAVLAFILAAVGIHAITRLFHSQRKREYCLRLALGASPSQIGLMILSRTLALVKSGFGLGLVFAIIGSTLISDLLFQTSPLDLLVLASAFFLLSLPVLLTSAVYFRGFLRSNLEDLLRH